MESESKGTPAQPNIVFILVDNVGYGGTIPTPRIDKLAGEGNLPLLYNLEWGPREEHQVDFPHAWVLHPMAAAGAAFMKSLAIEPPIKPGTPDPYLPPTPGEMRVEEHIQLGVITQFITTLVKTHKEAPQPDTGFQGNTG